MKISQKSKYKVARKLGAAVFEKTQGAKFALSEQKRRQTRRFSAPRTSFGVQLLEKQRVKYTYGISEKQLRNYVKEIIASKTTTPSEALYKKLETRLDSVILRAGFAKTRFQARQIAAHGHMLVNGRKVTIPSMHISGKDVVSVKESKQSSPLYLGYGETFKDIIIPEWIKVDPKKLSIEIKGEPVFKPTELHFDLQEVIQSFKR